MPAGGHGEGALLTLLVCLDLSVGARMYLIVSESGIDASCHPSDPNSTLAAGRDLRDAFIYDHEGNAPDDELVAFASLVFVHTMYLHFSVFPCFENV